MIDVCQSTVSGTTVLPPIKYQWQSSIVQHLTPLTLGTLSFPLTDPVSTTVLLRVQPRALDKTTGVLKAQLCPDKFETLAIAG